MENVKTLYADFVTDSNSKDMFVVTPEGNRFKFDYPTYTEEHEEVTIVDPWSHKTYIVVFNE
mgnify:CR=1 FL=1